MLNVRLHQPGPIPLNVQLQCAGGEMLALVGPSGSGKTSVLRAIAGLLPVAQGHISLDEALWFDSESRVDVPAEQRPIGMVFQHYALFPHLSALANVSLALPRDAKPEAALRLLQDMQLEGLAKRRPHELSGGQRQRVALARALARQPRLLLLDEAFSAVDQPTRQALYDELIKLREKVGVPIVMVTHDLREARLLADRMCILEAGETLQNDLPEQLMSRPRNARVAALVGLRDIHPGVFYRTGGAQGRLRWGDAESGIDLQTQDKGRLLDATPVRWVIAGEHVHLHLTSPEGANVVACRVERLQRLGAITSIACRLQAPPQTLLHLEITTRQARRLELEPGSAVFVQLDPQGIHIMPARHGAGSGRA